MFAKSDVNGKNENPIYTFLKSRCPSVRKEFQAPYKLYYDPYHQDDIRWNFEKFLLDHTGQPLRRYDEALDPMEIVPDIDTIKQTRFRLSCSINRRKNQRKICKNLIRR